MVLHVLYSTKIYQLYDTRAHGVHTWARGPFLTTVIHSRARLRGAASPERDAHGAAGVRAANVAVAGVVAVVAAAWGVSHRGRGRGSADDADDGIGDEGDQRTPLVRGG